MCVAPITLNKHSPPITVGCGRCKPCFAKYCAQWSFRLKIHYNQNPEAYFVTLTYDSQNLPTIKKNGKWYMTLQKQQLRSFIKKLRIDNQRKRGKNISYIACGEYGDKFSRPHYHMLIFNASPEIILKHWTYGSVHFGLVITDATIGYILKYSVKSKIYKLSHHQAPYERPFVLISKGIGAQLLEHGNPPLLIKYSGKTFQLPRYYTKKLGITLEEDNIFKQKTIDKHMQLLIHLEKIGIQYQDFKKQYSNFMYQTDKTNQYQNEITVTNQIIVNMLGQEGTLPPELYYKTPNYKQKPTQYTKSLITNKQ